MISHEHKCIFIHIPKTAGTSINSFFFPDVTFHFKNPDYERLFGWCPKRKLHMQHATSKQLLDTGLVTKEQWETYYKFTFVRNPWDRAYSDYKWIQQFSGLKDSFFNYVHQSGKFSGILNDISKDSFLGDHLWLQSDFFEDEGDYSVDYVGRFENFDIDIKKILAAIKIEKHFEVFDNKSVRIKEYSLFYSNSRKQLISNKFKLDIERFEYTFEDKRTGKHFYKKFI